METEEKTYPSGQHYSGRNRIPNIKQFVEGLDRDKKIRDAEIDKQQQSPNPLAVLNGRGGEAIDHIPTQKPGKNRRTVRDPITGKDVEIEDIDSKHLKTTEQPMVCTIRNLALEALYRLTLCLAHHSKCEPRQGINDQNRSHPVGGRIPCRPRCHGTPRPRRSGCN